MPQSVSAESVSQSSSPSVPTTGIPTSNGNSKALKEKINVTEAYLNNLKTLQGSRDEQSGEIKALETKLASLKEEYKAALTREREEAQANKATAEQYQQIAKQRENQAHNEGNKNEEQIQRGKKDAEGNQARVANTERKSVEDAQTQFANREAGEAVEKPTEVVPV